MWVNYRKERVWIVLYKHALIQMEKCKIPHDSLGNLVGETTRTVNTQCFRELDSNPSSMGFPQYPFTCNIVSIVWICIMDGPCEML